MGVFVFFSFSFFFLPYFKEPELGTSELAKFNFDLDKDLERFDDCSD